MLKPFLYEFLGTFAITLFGSFIRINNADQFTNIGIGYFLLIAGVTYGSKHISGSQFNPILTLSLLITE